MSAELEAQTGYSTPRFNTLPTARKVRLLVESRAPPSGWTGRAPPAGELLADRCVLSGDQTPLSVAFHEDVGSADTAGLTCPASRAEIVNSALETAVSP